jgi:hypothetical protein
LGGMERGERMIERTRYQASWGAWYVQVEFDDGRIVELKFKDEPKWEEVEKVALLLPPIEIPPAPKELVELTVDSAIAFLNEKLVEKVEVAKITEFITDKAVELKPIEPIKVVK